MRWQPENERWLLPVAVIAAAHAFAWSQRDPVGRAESVFLGMSSAAVVAVIASLGLSSRNRSTPEPRWTALLATAAIWIAYQGPSRGAVVGAVLVIGLAIAATRALLDAPGRFRAEGEIAEGEIKVGVAVALALGLQLLLRAELLLFPLLDLRVLISLLLLPSVAGLSVAVLAGRFGAGRAVLAGGLAAVLAEGWTMTSTLAMAALAAGELIGGRGHSAPVRWAAVAALALLPLWNPWVGMLFAIAGAGLAGLSGVMPPLLLIGVAGVAILGPQARAPVEAMRLWIGAALLIPAAALAPPGGRWHMRLGALVALAAALIAKQPEAMVAGIALAALASPAAGATASLQRAWGVIAVLGTCLLSSYPWVREDPLGDLLRLLGWTNEPSALLMLLALVPALGLILDRYGSEFPRCATRPLPIVCLALIWALSRGIGPTTLMVDSYGPVVLDASTASWERQLPESVLAGTTLDSIALDSHLMGGAALMPGAEVAVVELRGGAGEVLHEWPLRSGFDTAEWAASRADLTILAPEPWISTVAPSGNFFAHRYRKHLVPETDDGQNGETAPASLAIRRGEDLPAEAALAIYRLELRH